MRTLTEVFTPGAPPLPEGLRTLVVSPERELEPGMTVRASFTFRNQGGAPATGVRVRMCLPDGLVYLVGSGRLDGAELDDEQGNCPLLARNGAHIGDVAPGEERRIEIAYSVAGAIENGSTVELQAAVAAFEVAPVGSNVVRMAVRSHPILENSFTHASIDAVRDAKPGADATITVRVHNAGQSSAHDVVVVAPVPEHVSYIPNSASVNGRDIEPGLRTTFDRARAPIVVSTLPASATATLTYRVRIDEPLPDGTAIVVRPLVASQETAAFALPEVRLTVSAAPRFDDDQTSFSMDPADVEPGQRVTVRLVAGNAGSMEAERVTASLKFPEGLLVARGSSRVDGRPLRERKKEPTVYDLGRIPARASVELTVDAVVASPLPDGTPLEVCAELHWSGAAQPRPFRGVAIVHSRPTLPARSNGIVPAGSARARPREEIECIVALSNEGSAALNDAVLALRIDPAFEDVVVLEKNGKLPLEKAAVQLGRLEPYAARRFTVRARVRSPQPDRARIAIGASVRSAELGESALGEAAFVVESRPEFSAERSRFRVLSQGVLRPNGLAEVLVTIVNEGTDRANDVRLRMYVSPEARLESVDGATRERSSLLFGEIAAAASAEARVGLRLTRSLAREFPVTVEGVLTAHAMVPTPLDPVTIETTAEPDFSVGVLHAEPADVAEAGDEIVYTLHVRNGGDGPARRVEVHVEPLEALIYVPNSTSVNDVPVRDSGTLPPFANGAGIVLNDVDAGVEAVIAWREVVHNGLSAGDAIARVAHVRYDGDRREEIASPEIRVRSVPAFANTIPGLPFGLDGMVGPALAQRAISGEPYVELPPATPVQTPTNGAYLALESAQPFAVATTRSFAAGERERTVRFLREAGFGALVTHLFAIRALLPTGFSAGESENAAARELRDVLRDALDRLFIKLRLPNYVIADRDIETPSLRAACLSLLNGLPARPDAGGERTRSADSLTGNIGLEQLGALRAEVEAAQPGSAALWYALASIIVNGSHPLDAYRTLLCETLSDYRSQNAQAFLDALQRRAVPDLDAALDAVVCAMSVPG